MKVTISAETESETYYNDLESIKLFLHGGDYYRILRGLIAHLSHIRKRDLKGCVEGSYNFFPMLNVITKKTTTKLNFTFLLTV